MSFFRYKVYNSTGAESLCRIRCELQLQTLQIRFLVDEDSRCWISAPSLCSSRTPSILIFICSLSGPTRDEASSQRLHSKLIHDEEGISSSGWPFWGAPGTMYRGTNSADLTAYREKTKECGRKNEGGNIIRVRLWACSPVLWRSDTDRKNPTT